MPGPVTEGPPEWGRNNTTELEPALQAVGELYRTLRIARATPNDPESQRAVSAAWSAAYLHMPKLIAVDITKPAKPPTNAYETRQIGLEATEIDRLARGFYGRLLALGLVVTHPSSYPLGQAEVKALGRNRDFASYVGTRLDDNLHNRRRPPID